MADTIIAFPLYGAAGGQVVPIRAVDNGDGTWSIKTSGAGGATIPNTTQILIGGASNTAQASGLTPTVSGSTVAFDKTINNTVIGDVTPAQVNGTNLRFTNGLVNSTSTLFISNNGTFFPALITMSVQMYGLHQTSINNAAGYCSLGAVGSSGSSVWKAMNDGDAVAYPLTRTVGSATYAGGDSIAAASDVTTTFTITGSVSTDDISPNPSAAVGAAGLGLFLLAWSCSAGTITFTWRNTSAGALSTPAVPTTAYR